MASPCSIPFPSRKRKFMFFPMSRVLAHVSHSLEVARVLRSRGHEVVIAGERNRGSRSRLNLVEEAGFRVVDATEPDFDYIWDALMKWGGPALHIEFSRPSRWFPIERIMESQIRAIKDEEPDVVIGTGALTMSNVAYTLGIPALNIHNAYMVDFILARLSLRYWWHWYDWYFLSGQRNRVYRRYGVKPVRAIDLYRGVPLLSPDLPGLYETSSYFHNAQQIGPILFDLPAPLPEWYEELDDGTPNVYVTMGSTGRFDTFLRNAFHQLARLPYRFIVTTGGQIGAGTLQSAPGNFRFATYAPGAELMRHCAALVFHGGNGTMYQGLAAGLPMLAIPTHYEQILSSNIGVRAGFCRRLSSFRAGSSALGGAIREVVENAAYRDAAGRLAGAVRAADGAARAADLCEHAANKDTPAAACPC